MNEILTPEELARRGKQVYAERQYAEAAGLFSAAAQAYSVKNDLLMAAEMANNQSVALLQAEDAAGALRATDGTDQVFAQAGDKRRQAIALGNRGAAYRDLGRVTEAIADYEAAVELFRQAGERELMATVLRDLSKLQLRKGKHYEALASAEGGLSSKKSNWIVRLARKILAYPLRQLTK